MCDGESRLNETLSVTDKVTRNDIFPVSVFRWIPRGTTDLHILGGIELGYLSMHSP